MVRQSYTFDGFNPELVPSPCFVVDEVALEKNLLVLQKVQQHSGARILLALKAFSMFHLAPLIMKYLQGTCASGLYEARLGREEFGGEVHVYSPAYKEADMEQLLSFADHIVFNSFSQWERYRDRFSTSQNAPAAGLRINPEHSEGTTPLYDPCSPGSRLGICRDQFHGKSLDGISGLHFHTLCEQLYAPLERTLDVVEANFAPYLEQVQWVNFGGGHHITHPDYDVESLCRRIREFSEKYDVQVWLEPGEAIAIRTGVLVAEVQDIIQNHNKQIAIMDTSATCHMPDTLEMPYRAHIFGSGDPGVNANNYLLGGPSCLAGDIMGEYSFETALTAGTRLVFDDMAHYTMVKTTTFNGVPLPAIAVWNSEQNKIKWIRTFGYEDFRDRLS